jgi:hypothetical protein
MVIYLSDLKIFIHKKSLNEIMQDKGLAALGDTYVNFIYSLTKSMVVGKPQGRRVHGKVLAEALKNSGLRNSLLPKRLNTHELSNAVEALLVYCWINNCVSLDEAVSILSSGINTENLTREKEWKDAVKAFTFLLIKVKERLKLD